MPLLLIPFRFWTNKPDVSLRGGLLLLQLTYALHPDTWRPTLDRVLNSPVAPMNLSFDTPLFGFQNVDSREFYQERSQTCSVYILQPGSGIEFFAQDVFCQQHVHCSVFN